MTLCQGGGKTSEGGRGSAKCDITRPKNKKGERRSSQKTMLRFFENNGQNSKITVNMSK